MKRSVFFTVIDGEKEWQQEILFPTNSTCRNWSFIGQNQILVFRKARIRLFFMRIVGDFYQYFRNTLVFFTFLKLPPHLIWVRVLPKFLGIVMNLVVPKVEISPQI